MLPSFWPCNDTYNDQIARYAINTQNNLIKSIIFLAKDFLQKCTSIPMSLTIKKILSSKGLKFPEKWWNQNFLVICPSTHCVLNAYKVSQNSMLRYKRICTYKPFIIKFNIWPKFKRAEIPRNIIMESEFLVICIAADYS